MNCQQQIALSSSSKESKVEAKGCILSPGDAPANFNSLPDDVLHKIHELFGKHSYAVFGGINKRCKDLFTSYEIPKKTCKYAHGPLELVQQQTENSAWWMPISIIWYNRTDLLNWCIEEGQKEMLSCICYNAATEGRFSFLREVFDRSNCGVLEYLRKSGLCGFAAWKGHLEILKFLTENGCRWDPQCWDMAQCAGHDHILNYLQENGYNRLLAEIEYCSESESDWEDY